MTSRGSAECPPRPFGGPGGLAPGLGEPPLDAQCVLPLRIRHYVAWLIVTQRAAVPSWARAAVPTDVMPLS